MPRLLPVVLLASAVLAGGANAQTNVWIQEMLSACADGLLVADTDRGGWVTPADVEAAMEANFILLDGDGDGAVTQDDFAACRTGSMTETRRSATLYPSNVFFISDEDDDDVLDRDIWLAQAIVQMGKVSFHDDGANPVSYDAVMQGSSLPAVELDRNSDGDAVVTLEEYSAAGRLRYDQAAEAALSDPEVGVPVDALAEGR